MIGDDQPVADTDWNAPPETPSGGLGWYKGSGRYRLATKTPQLFTGHPAITIRIG